MPNGNRSCNGWCAPTVIYAFFAIVGALMSLFATNKYDEEQTGGENKVLAFLVHFIVTLLWIALLYWLCSNCWYGVAWAIVLLPFIVVLLVVALLIGAEAGSHGRLGHHRYHRYPIYRHRGRLPEADYWSPLS